MAAPAVAEGVARDVARPMAWFYRPAARGRDLAAVCFRPITVSAMFHLGWDHVEAKLIDQRFIRRTSSNAHGSGASYEVWEYIVEFPDADG